ncbi:hypothetical protein HD554DRAFT_2297912 [Boletus coccyginus]|nr:hypothetical protein HD554DRAFT_2297912 [Boletus coccyginus]
MLPETGSESSNFNFGFYLHARARGEQNMRRSRLFATHATTGGLLGEIIDDGISPSPSLPTHTWIPPAEPLSTDDLARPTYSFRRPLEQAEWNTLRSYTHRIGSILNFGSAFQYDGVGTILIPATSEPLFPNLRYLRHIFTHVTTTLIRQPFPSLISLDYSFVPGGNLSLSQFKEFLEFLPGSSPDMRKVSIHLYQSGVIFDKLVSDFICRWANPQTMYCPQVSLDMNALTHLSRTPGLTRLTFAQNAPLSVTPSDPLPFPTLYELKIFSESLFPISKLLAHFHLPAVTDFAVGISSCPSRQNITSFLAALQRSGVSDSITRLRLTQTPSPSLANLRPDVLVLATDDLWSSMALRNLRRIDLNLGWNVGLTDSGLLTLASARPHLEHLLINEDWGWQTSGGITPDGLVRLLQTCPSLSRLALAIDTRDYTEMPPSRLPASLVFHQRRRLCHRRRGVHPSHGRFLR